LSVGPAGILPALLRMRRETLPRVRAGRPRYPQAGYLFSPNGAKQASPGQATQERRPGIGRIGSRALKARDKQASQGHPCPAPSGLVLLLTGNPGRRSFLACLGLACFAPLGLNTCQAGSLYYFF